MKNWIGQNATSQLVHVFIADATATDGSGLTGLTYSSPGLTAYYIRPGDSSTTTIALSAGTLGTWSSGGFVEIDSVNMPGWYEIGLPNACLTVLGQVGVVLRGAVDMAQCNFEVLVATIDPVGSGVTVGGYASGEDPATLLLANSRFKDLLSYVDCKYTYDTSTGEVTFYDTDGTTVLFTATLTKDGSGNIIERTIS